MNDARGACDSERVLSAREEPALGVLAEATRRGREATSAAGPGPPPGAIAVRVAADPPTPRRSEPGPCGRTFPALCTRRARWVSERREVL